MGYVNYLRAVVSRNLTVEGKKIRLRVVPHFSSRTVERAKRERA